MENSAPLITSGPPTLAFFLCFYFPSSILPNSLLHVCFIQFNTGR